MKVLVLYRPDSEFARAAESFVHDFSRQHEGMARMLEEVNIDSRDGIATASLYDIMQHPAVLVLAEDGRLIKDWQGPNLPLLDELAGYLHA
jgi:hypothetical protein